MWYVCVCSGEDSFTSQHVAIDKAADHLCYFTHRQKEGTNRLSSETRDVLQHRVDPSARESDRMAVETLLYTPGSKSKSNLPTRHRKLAHT